MQKPIRGVVRSSLGVMAMLGAVGGPGCARTLTITQADYINTAVHRGREPGQRTGERLEVSIVSVYPDDLNKPQNAALAPDSGITCDAWYKYRPTGDRSGGFEIPRSQIVLLTDDTGVYGRRAGPSLRGAKLDGVSKIKVTGIKFRAGGWKNVTGSVYDKRSAIYVFPRFIGPDGKVEKVEPARFVPPGSFPRNMTVEIGVEDPGGAARQYIRNTTSRSMGRDESAR